MDKTPNEQPSRSPESQRLEEDLLRNKNWKRWGPYLSERQWGTVREDYSPGGDNWGYLTHDMSRSYTYRWGEDGILGLTDRQCRLCFALCMWNGKDPILKERLFGLTGGETNHGEDVKEQYFYLKSSPTHSYMQGLYKYPIREFPYSDLVARNKQANRTQREYEINDTGVWADENYFDVFVEYAKADDNDVLIKVTVHNCSNEEATIHMLPQFWHRNTWIFGNAQEKTLRQVARAAVGHRDDDEPTTRTIEISNKPGKLQTTASEMGKMYFECETFDDHSASTKSLLKPVEWIFTENNTNKERLYNVPNDCTYHRTLYQTRAFFLAELNVAPHLLAPYVKDAFHEYIVHGKKEAINPQKTGTKVAAHHVLSVPAQGEVILKFRLYSESQTPEESFGPEFDAVFKKRIAEMDEYYDSIIPAELFEEEKKIVLQAFAGLCWSKQFFYYVIKEWLEGDKDMPPPPSERLRGRNHDWNHLYNKDIISMPDKWEYPWYAVWDLAFHTVSFSLFDIDFAKSQLSLFLREWYMHPSGWYEHPQQKCALTYSLPAYEFNFSDVNPPVHAWACWKVYKQSIANGAPDIDWLASCFQKLVINFTWWVNRKDPDGKNIFSGGFLGLDNIGVFDRSQPMPTGGELHQADGTSWMAFYCIYMMKIAMELAIKLHKSYEDMASKFFEHFVLISDAMNEEKSDLSSLWDAEDGFYYDTLVTHEHVFPLKVRSLVGLSPLFACGIVSRKRLSALPDLEKRTFWFLENRPELGKQVTILMPRTDGEHDSKNPLGFMSIPKKNQIESMLKYLFCENEFLSPYGIRSLSKFHRNNPYIFRANGVEHRVDYVPGESDSGMFGGNSNWRGPIWAPMNFLLIEGLERLDNFFGAEMDTEFPTGSGTKKRPHSAANAICEAFTHLFLPNLKGERPSNGGDPIFMKPRWKDLILFYEYFDGDTGRGLGASHQTGWTSLVCNCFWKIAEQRRAETTDLNGPKTIEWVHTNKNVVDPEVWTEDATFCYEVQQAKTDLGFDTVYQTMVELHTKTPWIYMGILLNYAKFLNLDSDICLLPKRKFWLHE